MVECVAKSKNILLVKNLDGHSFKLLKNANFEDIIERVNKNYEGIEIYLKNNLELGFHYQLVVDEKTYEIDLTNFVDFEGFDNEFNYDGEDLGSNIVANHTIFKLFAPLAYQVKVVVFAEEEQSYFMQREDKGIFACDININLENKEYLYEIYQNGHVMRALDPYAKAVTINKSRAVVIDLDKYQTKKYELKEFHRYTDAIIYETSVRDFTVFEKSSHPYKGTYYGLSMANQKYKNSEIALDLLKKLGVTHVQLLPVNAFCGVDETRINQEYNWGYNPYLYMALEGSMSINPHSPTTRIQEFKHLVASLHEAGIRVNLDVVFNHVYEYEQSVFQKIVPNYYFRREHNRFSNGSFCGNDLDTKRPMVRKIILDTLKFFVKFYDIDGFRFDLLGIVDLETSKIIEKTLRSLKQDIMLYGEGWNMPTFLPNNEKTTIENAKSVPSYAFFNDFFRDTLRGNNYGNGQGYLLGAHYLQDNFIKAFKGMHHDGNFLSPSQSINYSECHDNNTLFDKIALAMGKNNEQNLRILKLGNAITILACGVPFIHMGQEVGLTKYYADNTYNMGDKYNQYDFDVLNERKSLLRYLADLIKIRKKYSCFRLDNYLKINEMLTFEDLEGKGLKITYHLAKGKELAILFNTSKNQNIYYSFKEDQKVVFNEVGIVDNFFVQSLILSPLNTVIVVNRNMEEENV